jgi:CO dehydrogenase/acetyl-CoA synthase alpha subunit
MGMQKRTERIKMNKQQTTQIAETLNDLAIGWGEVFTEKEKEAISIAISNLFEVEKIREKTAREIYNLLTEHCDECFMCKTCQTEFKTEEGENNV